MNTISLGANKIDSRLKAYIAESVREVLADPDFGLELTDEMKRRLRASRKASRRAYVSLATICNTLYRTYSPPRPRV